MPKSARYPFVYCGHGSAYPAGDFYLVVWFARAVPDDQRKAIAARAPGPLQPGRWLGSYLECEVDRAGFLAATKASLGKSDWSALEDQIDSWLLAVHDECPVVFVAKDSSAYREHRLSEWHAWSVGRYSTVVEPLLSSLKACVARDAVPMLFRRDALTPRDVQELNLRNALEYLLDEVPTMGPDFSPTYDVMRTLDRWLGRGKPRRERLNGLAPFAKLLHYAWSQTNAQELVSRPGWKSELRRIMGALDDDEYREAARRHLSLLCQHLPEARPEEFLPLSPEPI